MSSTTATVEVLTAEVRVLMVGSRQITLSVARQLDLEAPSLVEPFGRIRSRAKAQEYDLEVIGRYRPDGTLCRSQILVRQWTCQHGRSDCIIGYDHGSPVITKHCPAGGRSGCADTHRWLEYLFDEHLDGDRIWETIYLQWQDLPLIVLAGLR